MEVLAAPFATGYPAVTIAATVALAIASTVCFCGLLLCFAALCLPFIAGIHHAAGAFLSPFKVVGAAAGVVFAVLREAVVLLSGSLMIIVLIALLVGFGVIAMPMFPESPTILGGINTVSARITNDVQPIVNGIAEGLACTKNPLDSVWNRFVRIFFSIIRAIRNILVGNPFDLDLPDVFKWATYGYAINRNVHSYAALSNEMRRLADIRESTYDTEWGRVRDMNRAKLRRQLSPIDAYCSLTENVGDFVMSLLNIYAEFQDGLFSVIALFYTPSGGFDASFIEMVLQYLIVWLVRHIPGVQCLINPDTIDITTLYFEINIRGLWLCICPWGYDNLSEVPDLPRVDLMILKCICPHPDSDNPYTIITHCIPGFSDALDEVENLVTNIIPNFTLNVVGKVQDIVNGFVGKIQPFVDQALGLLNKIRSFLPFSEEEAIRYANMTRVVYVERVDCPAPPPCPAWEMPPMPPMRRGFNATTARLHETIRMFANGQTPAPKWDAKPYPWEAKRALLTQAQRDFLDDPHGHIQRALNVSIEERARALYGPQVAEHAVAMHRGLVRFFQVLPELWEMQTIHQMTDALQTPEIVGGFYSAMHVVAAYRARTNRTYAEDQTRGFLRVATRAVLAPQTLHPAIASLHSAGDFAGAERARAWLAMADISVPSHESAMATMQLRREVRRMKHATALIGREAFVNITRQNAVSVHFGFLGGSFVLSIVTQVVGSSPTQAGVAFAGMLGTVVEVIATGFATIIPAVFQIAANFFYNLANPSLAFRNDVVSALVQRIVPLLGEVYGGTGIDQNIMDEFNDALTDTVLAQLEYSSIVAVRFFLGIFAPTRAPFTDGNGLPDESLADYLSSGILFAPVDESCIDSNDCDGYPCRWTANPAVECTEEYPYQAGLCVNITTGCYANSDCASGICLQYPAYNTSCPDTGCPTLEHGWCMTELCVTNSTCPGDAGAQLCLDRQQPPGTYCNDSAPCTTCRCVAFPLRPFQNITAPNLTVQLAADCGAVGLDAALSVPWDYDSYNGNMVAFAFSWDGVAWELRNIRTFFRAARVLAGTLVYGWHVPTTTIFIPFFSSFLWFLPVGAIGSFAHGAFYGSFVKDAIGGAEGVLRYASYFTWIPWLGPWIDTQLHFVADFTDVETGLICIGMASGQIALGAAGLFVILFVVGSTLIAALLSQVFFFVVAIGIFVFNVFWTVGRASYVGARISRMHARDPVFMGARPPRTPRVSRHLLPSGHPHRERWVGDTRLDGVTIRPPRNLPPQGWFKSILHGMEMALYAFPEILRRKGDVPHVIDVLADRHGKVRHRVTDIAH